MTKLNLSKNIIAKIVPNWNESVKSKKNTTEQVEDINTKSIQYIRGLVAEIQSELLMKTEEINSVNILFAATKSSLKKLVFHSLLKVGTGEER